MSDNSTSEHHGPAGPTTIAEVLDGLQPMGDLSRFMIDDLSPDEEDEFFRIIQDA
jgi:hypothetical protein